MVRPIVPLTDKFINELVRPRGPANVPAVGSEAPDFTLPYAQFLSGPPEDRVEYGRTITLSALRGRPVVLNLTRIFSERVFCPNCAPHLASLRAQYSEFSRRNVHLLVVSSTDLETTSYVAEVLRAPFPILSDPDWKVFTGYGMGSAFGAPLPGVFIIDAQGIIRWSWVAPFSPIFSPPPIEELTAVLDSIGATPTTTA
ncbi:MAG: alkyl hydroperoxide reductase [Chloroflexus sp.]|uniref:peroxiredoxin family protein n=1 Tax=Chloroflexus sp. TaxID=1904827 RepID=UPI0021DD0577|nr:peroxiredoxin family protein [Chloroflexus sp.]GIV90351.1 MAG: alkyl hydroperoxide reductase [Chloroflexus sp.]